MDKLGNGSGRLDMKFQIGSVMDISFRFQEYDPTTETYTPEDISTKTFSFFLRKYKGARNSQKLFNLTNGNGISVPVYSTDEIRCLTTIPSTAEEGEYYFELRRTDLNAPKIYGLCYLSYESQKI